MLPSKLHPSHRRFFTHLTPNLDKRLLAYATAAGATGVRLLAMAPTVEAQIIYTPANIAIPENGGLIQIDINNDGTPDFGFYRASGTCMRNTRAHRLEGCSFAYFEVLPAQSENEVAIAQNCPAELPAGIRVGPAKNFQPGDWDLWWWGGDSTGSRQGCPWHNNKGGFLGLKFVVNGETYYGWARISLNGGATITGYAYEAEPNKPILTGKPKPPTEDASGPSATLNNSISSPVLQRASLGVLARGASALPVWRRLEEIK